MSEARVEKMISMIFNGHPPAPEEPTNQTNCPSNLQTTFAAQEKQVEQLYIQLSTFWYCFLALITTIGLLVSSVSNIIIIYLFTSTPSLRKNPSNIIAVNLSISDMLYCIQWPSVIYCCLTQSVWILEHDFICKSLGFITVSTALVSILTVSVMSIERAIVVKYSIRAKNKLTYKSAWLIIILIWLICLASCLPPLFGKLNRYTLDPSKTSCTLDYLSLHSQYKFYILILYIGYYVIPIVAISISYGVIILTFNESSLSLREVQSSVDDFRNSCLYLNQQGPTGTNTSTSQQISRCSSNFVWPIVNETRVTSSKQSGRETSISVAPALKDQHSSDSNNNDGVYLDEPIERPDGAEKESINSNGQAGFLSSKRSRSTDYNILSGTCFKAQDSGSKLEFAPRILDRKLSTICQAIGRQIKQSKKATFNLETSKHCKEKQSSSNESDQVVEINRRHSVIYKAQQKIFPTSQLIDPSANQLNSRQNQFNSQAAQLQRTRNALQFRLAKMSFYLILLWLVSWSPIAWLAMLNSILNCRRANATAVFLASTMTKLGPAFDVFIYGLSHPKLKSQFKLIIKKPFMLFV